MDGRLRPPTRAALIPYRLLNAVLAIRADAGAVLCYASRRLQSPWQLGGVSELLRQKNSLEGGVGGGGGGGAGGGGREGCGASLEAVMRIDVMIVDTVPRGVDTPATRNADGLPMKVKSAASYKAPMTH